MSVEEVQQHVVQWIENTLSVPSPHFNNLPPCPYSHGSLVKDRVDIRHEPGEELLQKLAALGEAWDDSHDVIVVMCDKQSISLDKVKEGVSRLAQELAPRDLLVNFDHPDCTDPKYRVVSSNGKYVMVSMQRLNGFVEASRVLFKKGYYKNVDFADLSHFTSFKGNFASEEEWQETMAGGQLLDFSQESSAIVDEVLSGLQGEQKSLPAKINYFREGADLYEEVCRTKEYYLTRTEISIMERFIHEMASCLPEELLMIEYGSGSGRKTRILFDHLANLVGYVPVDVSKEQLIDVSSRIVHKYPRLEVLPVCADYTRPFELPFPKSTFSRRLFYYPGSTIGNQDPSNAVSFLRQMRGQCERGDALLIGVDLAKDPALLQQAYDDPGGANREFILHPLKVLKRDFGVDFEISNYRHHVCYDEDSSCVRIYLQCLRDHALHINGASIEFSEGELIERAVSYKYSPADFRDMAEQAGWHVEKMWTDERKWFGVHYLSAS